MIRIVNVCCLVLLTSACSNKKTPSVESLKGGSEGTATAAPIAAVPVPEGTHLLLPKGTKLYSAKDSAESVATVGAGQRVEVFRIVSKDEQWIEVETLPFGGLENGLTTCHDSTWWAADALTLRAFVQASDSAKVVHTQTRIDFDDESYVELMPGVLVTSGPSETHGVYSHDIGFDFVLLREDFVGTSFVPGKPITRPNTPSVNFASVKFAGPDGGLKVKEGTYSIQQDWETMRTTKALELGYLLKGFSACIAVQGHSVVSPPREEPKTRFPRKYKRVLMAAAKKDKGPPYKVAAGTLMFWKNGEPAGSVSKKLVMNEELSLEADGLRCTTIDGKLEVCFQATAVELDR